MDYITYIKQDYKVSDKISNIRVNNYMEEQDCKLIRVICPVQFEKDTMTYDGVKPHLMPVTSLAAHSNWVIHSLR